MVDKCFDIDREYTLFLVNWTQSEAKLERSLLNEQHDSNYQQKQENHQNCNICSKGRALWALKSWIPRETLLTLSTEHTSVAGVTIAFRVVRLVSRWTETRLLIEAIEEIHRHPVTSPIPWLRSYLVSSKTLGLIRALEAFLRLTVLF